MSSAIDTVLVTRSDASAAAVSRCLTRAGYAVLRADDGEHALALALKHKPTTCVLDSDLAGLTALEVARELRADPSTAEVRIIALSERSQVRERRAWRDAGFADMCAKPVQVSELLRALQPGL